MAKKPLTTFFKKSGGGAIILALEGDLGGGKTAFLQGFAKGLGIKQKITSPTFVILKKFQVSPHQNPEGEPRTKASFIRGRQVPYGAGKFGAGQAGFKFHDFYHIDCYRIEKPKEILDLDFKKIISEPKNIVAIEWSEKIKKILPKNRITIKFLFLGKNTRKMTILAPSNFL